MSGEYVRALVADESIKLHIKWTTRRRDVTNYSVVLTQEHGNEVRTIRVFDGAHGVNEMHRFTRTGGKQAAEIFHAGTLGEGLRTAIENCARRYPLMIEGWDR
jgi:hypothetical protein